jgi:hypothetical protein
MSYATEVLADSPWLYWRLGEAAAATTAVDASGNSRNGTVTGSTFGQAGAISGDANTAVSLDAVDDKITSAATFAPSNVTLELWVKIPSTPASNGYLFTLTDGTGNGGALETWVNTNARVQSRIWTGAEVITPDSGTALTVGAWQHVVVRLDGTNAKTYLNGTEVSTIACALFTDTRPFTVGGFGGTGYAARYAFQADEAAVYASALTPTRIAAHYTAGAAPAPSGSTVLIKQSGAFVEKTLRTKIGGVWVPS